MSLQRSNIDKFQKFYISDLKNKIIIPDFQRPSSSEHIESIYSYISDCHSKGREPIITGCFIITKCGDKEYLIDGNHRYCAYVKALDNLGKDIPVIIQYIETIDEKERIELFNRVNNCLPAPDMAKGVNHSHTNPVVKYFTEKYPRIFSNSKGKSQRPKINLINFIEDISNVIARGVDCKTIISKLEEYNLDLKRKDPNFFKKNKSDTSKSIEHLCQKAIDQGGLFFGMIPDSKWMYSLFGLDKIVQLKRVNVPAPLRVKLWNRFFGDHTRIGECLICKDEIRFEKFHACHDKADSLNGEMTIDNLYPGCEKCNLSMGKLDFETCLKKFKLI